MIDLFINNVNVIIVYIKYNTYTYTYTKFYLSYLDFLIFKSKIHELL